MMSYSFSFALILSLNSIKTRGAYDRKGNFKWLHQTTDAYLGAPYIKRPVMINGVVNRARRETQTGKCFGLVINE